MCCGLAQTNTSGYAGGQALQISDQNERDHLNWLNQILMYILPCITVLIID